MFKVLFSCSMALAAWGSDESSCRTLLRAVVSPWQGGLRRGLQAAHVLFLQGLEDLAGLRVGQHLADGLLVFQQLLGLGIGTELICEILHNMVSFRVLLSHYMSRGRWMCLSECRKRKLGLEKPQGVCYDRSIFLFPGNSARKPGKGNSW